MHFFLQHRSLQHRRSKRSARSSKPKWKRYQLSTLINHLIYPSDRQYVTHNCQRYTLYINFKELRWDDWILAPTGYGAFYCAGSCEFPIPHHVQATAHAIIQNMAHLMQSHHIPKPCCAPSKLEPISLLYETKGTQFLKRYRGMIAKECACQ